MMTSIARYRILGALAGLSPTPLSKLELNRFTGCKLVAVTAALEAMLATGLVVRSGQRHYAITNDGRAALGRHINQRRKDHGGTPRNG